MADPRYGLDTGFFFALMRGDDRPRDVWEAVIEEEATGIVSTLSAYELQRNALKGLLVRADVEALLEELPVLCTIHETLALDSAQHAAHLGWGTGLAMADALILQAFLEEEATRIFTTDRDLTAYDGGPPVEIV